MFDWNGPPSDDEKPIGWKVSWRFANARPFDREHAPVAQSQTFRHHAQAAQHKAGLERKHGANVAVCMAAVFPGPRARERRRRQEQGDFLDTWPLQLKPGTNP